MSKSKKKKAPENSLKEKENKIIDLAKILNKDANVKYLNTQLLNKDANVKYLNAFYKMSQQELEITYSSLSRYLGLKSRSSTFEFIKRRAQFFNNFLAIKHGKGQGYESTVIELTEQGKRYIELIYHFKDYYKAS